MRTSSTLQRLTIVAAAIVVVGVVSWAAISSITAASAPTGLTATAGDTQVTLTWNDPIDSTITGYQVLQVAIDKLVGPSTGTGAIGTGDRFGDSVGVDNNRAVVGAPFQTSKGNSNNDIDDGGWGHAFSRSSGEWNYDEFLAVSTPQKDGRLGSSVAVAGSTTIVGAPSYIQNNNADPGRITIASWDSETDSWGTEFTKVGQVGNDLFGSSVALDTGIAVVGAPGAQIGSDTLAGKAYLYTKNNSVWGNAATAIWSAGTNAGAGTIFGSSVAVDGSTVVVGSPGEDSYSGAAYVFTKDSMGIWSAVRLTASDRANADSFGRWVAVDGDFVVVGAWQDDDGGTDSGSVYVFTKPSGGWGTWVTLSTSSKAALTAKLTASDAAADDHFGWSVAIDGDNVVVGAYGNDDDGSNSGSVYLFTKPTSDGWVTATETIKLTAPDAAAGDQFGYSVAAGGGSRAIVGAPGDDRDEDSDIGAAYVFSIPAWTGISNSDKDTISHTVTGLDNDVEYTFLVRPVVGSGYGPASESKQATPVQSSAATPANLTAVAVVDQVTLSWDDPNDSTITGYKYRQKVAAGTFGQWTTIPDSAYGEANTTGYTVRNLTDGQTYTFQIRAVDEAGDAANSGDVTVTTILAAPTTLMATVGAGQIGLNWDNPNNTLITKYQYITDGGANFTDIPNSSATTTAYTVTGLSNGDEYTLAVRAANASVNGEAATVTATPLLPAPTNPVATPYSERVVLSWDNLAGVGNYGITTAASGSTPKDSIWSAGSGTTTTVELTSLTNNTEYTFTVRAVYVPPGVSSDPPKTIGMVSTVTATPIPVPTAPANFTATPGDGMAALSWADPGNTTITKYELLQLAEESGLIASDAAKNDRFGVSVAVDDDTAVVGAFQPTYTDPDTSLDVSRPGAAYVYTKDSNGAWSQQAKLTASDGAAGDEFGVSVAVDGDTVVVGARGNVSKTGAIYVFTKPSDGDWTSTITETKLTATGGAANDLFGASVALYGESTIVVGAPGDQNSVGGTDVSTGSAYVFTLNSATGEWSQNAKLTASNAGADDLFGNSVAVDDDTIAVGAYGKDGNSLTDSGLVYVFVKPEADGGWANASTETVQLRASDRAANDNFGRSVAVDTDTIVVGASGDRNTVAGTELSTGSAYVFTRPDNGWVANSVVTETAKLTASDAAHTDQFGRSVAVYGDTIVVGAHQNDDDGTDSGSIYVFIKPTNGWTDTTGTVKLTASNAATGDRFGIALALDGDTALVAAPRNDANDDDDDTGNDVLDAGSAYVIGTSGWVKIPDTAAAIRSQTVTGLTNNIKHTFAMRAVNASGNGPAATATATPKPAPPAPQNLQATPGDRQVAISWDDPNDSGITRYQYSTDYMINGGNGNNGVASFNDIPGSNTATTSYTVTGLAHSTTYTLSLRAVNPSGDGDASTVTALTLPAKPTGLTGIEYNSQVELGWDGSDDSTITKYQLLQIAPSKLTVGDAGRDDDFFGMAVAMDGDTALVGALQAYDADFNYRPGAAYLFTKNSESGEWTQATLTALDGNDGDEFGRSVALDGDTAVVGAPGADKGVAGEGQVTGTGAAYVFIRDSAGSWTQPAKLTANDAEANDQFAYSVAVYDDTVVIGAHQDDDGGAESGSIYVFTKPANGGWTSTTNAVKLTAPDAAAGGYYGNSVAINGNTIVVGAHKADSAYAITKPSSDANDDGSIDWQDWDALDADGKAALTAALTAFNATAGDEFGISVAIDGNTIVVGAHEADSAYAITKPSSDANNDGSIDWADWDSLDADRKAALTATLTAFDATAGDEFGISVAVSGDTIVVGAHKDDDKGDESGSVYVFTKPAAGWDTTTETAKIIDQDGAEDDQFGSSLAVDGNTVLIGARGDGSNEGAAHIMGIPSWTDISDSAAGGANATSYTVTGLTNDVMYTFQLRAVAADSHSPASDRLNVTPKAVPHAPANLSATPGNAHVALSWDDPTDPNNPSIDGYQYSTDGGESFTDIEGSDATTSAYTVSGLANGRTYALAVRAVNSLGNGAASTLYVVMVPAAPTNLSAAPDDGKVVLSWADPGNATITKYQYSTDGGTNFSDFDGGRNSDATANTVAGLTNYTAYWFQIRAVNDSGAGPASNIASSTPRAPKPAKPTGLSAQPRDLSVMLNWDNPNYSTIDKYQISEVIPEDFLAATGGAAGDHFGISVAIYGNTAVIGADRADSKKGSAYIFTRDSSGDWTQQAKLDGENTGDQFGWSVAVDGDTVVVGAHAYDGEDDEANTLTNSGAVYVFTKPTSSGGWADTIAAPVKLTPTIPEAYAFFGGSVALAGNTLAIGSRLYDAGGRLSSGAAYVFTKDSTGWSQAAKLTASTSLQLAYLGYSLAVDGDTVLVGAYGDDTVLGELGSGSAYVFDKPPGGWDDDDYSGNETAKLTASDRQPSGYFGFSVALDGDTAVIGARQHSDSEIGAGSGAAYVFTKQSGVWGEKAKLTPSDAAARDNFGVSVAVDGDTVVVGSWQDDDNGRNSGSAYVFEKPTLGWARTFETLKLTAPDGAANDRFGWSVAVDLDDVRGDLALVGAYSDDTAAALDAGSAHMLGIPDWVDIGGSDDATISLTVTKELDDPDTDLSNGTEYAFQVRALNRSGAGPASDGVSATPLGPPSDLRGLMSEDGDTQVRLYWNAPAEDSARAPITRYEYQYQEKDTNGNVGAWNDNWEKIPDSGPATTEYMKTELVNKAYTFRVRAVNMIGESPASTVDATPTGVPPAAPDLTAEAGDTQVRLKWNDPQDFSIDRYEYQWTGNDGTSSWIGVPKLMGRTIAYQYTVAGLTNDVEYTFRVRAVDEPDDFGVVSVDVTATPSGVELDALNNPVPIRPDPPANLTADPGDSKVTLTWDDPDDASIDKYQYQYLQENTDGAFSDWGTDWTDVPSSNASTTEYIHFGLTNGVNYRFRIRAVDLAGPGTDDDEFSNPSGNAEAIPLPDRPRAPTNLNVTARNQEVTLTWRAPPSSVVDKYEVLHLQASELAPVNVAVNDKFGYSVAVDGDIAVVGAYQDDSDEPNGIVDSGAAYVFTRSGGVVWDEGVKLTASDGAPYDNFGISVAVDDNTIVIGASGDDDNGADSGSVYVFTRDPYSGVWSQAAKLTASDGEALGYFGQSVAVSGDTVLVGAYQDDDEGNDLEDSGSVYVFTKPTSEGGWSDWHDLPQTATNENNDDKDRLTAKLTASDAADDDNFGTSVALDGDTAVIGAPGDDDNGIDSGSVYVFVKPLNGWATTSTHTAKLTDRGGAAGDSFGVSVAVDGVTAVVGAHQHDDKGIDSGSAYVFMKPSGTAWITTSTWTAKLTADDGEAFDYFGYSVAVDGDTAAVGAYQDDDKGADSGSVYVFTKDSETGTWRQTNKLTEDPGEADGWFGYSVAVDAGAHTALIGAGSAHVMDVHDWEEVSASGLVITHTIANLTNNRQYDFQVRAVNLAGAGAQAEEEATPLLTVYTPPPNALPRFEEGNRTTRTVPENAEAGTPVGGPVTATDQDNDQLEYSLSGTGQASFDVDSRTAQITTKTLLDYEVENEYWVRLRVRDGEGGIGIIDVTITIEDVGPPSQPGVPEISSTGPTGLAISWTAADNQGPGITDYDVQYRETGGEFQDAGYDGVGTSMTLNDLEPETGYEAQVRAITDEGASLWSESGRGQTEEPPPPPTPEPPPPPTPEPTPPPTPEPTPAPTPEPTPAPTPEPTPAPTPEPTPAPTPEPTRAPTPEATVTPTPETTVTPTPEATIIPTPEPTATRTPMPEPTVTPTTEPEEASTLALGPSRTPAPVPTSTTAPAPTATVGPVPPGADGGERAFPWWAIVSGGIGVVGVILLILSRRRRRR